MNVAPVSTSISTASKCWPSGSAISTVIRKVPIPVPFPWGPLPAVILAAAGGPELHLRQVHGQVVGEPAVPGPEALRLGGVGGDGDHLCPAGLEGLLAVPVGAGDAGLLAAVPAGAGGGVKEVGEGHSLTLLLSRIVLLQRES